MFQMELNSKTTKLLFLNTLVVLLARITILLTLAHFVFTTSAIHAIIIAVAYLVIEVMDFQLKYMLKTSVNDFLTSLLPKEKPNLTVVETTEEDTTNQTTH